MARRALGDRVVYGLLRPAARVALAFGIPLKQLRERLQMAYFHEARDRGLKLREIADILDVSPRSAALLSKQLKENFLDVEAEVALPRRIEFLLWAEPLSAARIKQVLVEVDGDEVDAALDKLRDEGRIVAEPGPRGRWRVARAAFRLVDEKGWLSRLDGLDTLLATIRSRCRRLRFGWLTEADVARVLVEREGVAAAAAAGLAAASGGSVSRALAEQSGGFEDDRDAALALLEAARARAIPPRLKAAAALAQHGSKRRDREALQERFGIVLSLLRDLGALAAGGTVPLANDDVAGALRELAPAFTLDRVSAAFTSVERASQHLERNASPKIVADWLAVNL